METNRAQPNPIAGDTQRPPVFAFELSDDLIASILRSIIVAERNGGPGFAKHATVHAAALSACHSSPPPLWVYLLYPALDALIKALIDWLKEKFGDEWLAVLETKIGCGLLPWQS